MPNANLPIEGYPSEYLQFLKAASIKEHKVTFDTKQRAFVVRAKINMLRSKMKAAKHPLATSVAKVELVIRGVEDGHKCFKDCPSPDSPHFLVGRPRDTEILSSFHEAGIMPETLDDHEDPLAKFGEEGAE